MAGKIKVVLVPCGDKPRVAEIEDTLAAKQVLVGGMIEILSCRGDGLEYIANDEGLFTKDPNRAVFANKYMEDAGYIAQWDFTTPVRENELYTILYGDFIVAKYDKEKDQYSDMNDAEIATICEEFKNPSTGKDAAELIKIGLIVKRPV